MGEFIEITAADDHVFSAYRATAGGDRGRRGGVVVIQEIFGVNDHIRSVCDRYAEQGYEVHAPALFDRVAKGTELGYCEDDVKRGRDLRGELEWTDALLDVQACVAAMRGAGEVGVVGYCYGGSVSWLAACRVIGTSAAVCYYGGQIIDHVDQTPRCPVMLHFGARDAMIPMADVDFIRARHADAPLFVYDAEHGFSCDARASYDEASAAQALERTLAFFGEHVG